MKNKFTKTVLMAVAVLGLFVTFTGKVQADHPFVGQIMYVAFGFPPNKNWLPCDGRELKIKDYKDLWGMIRNTYGGSAEEGTFRLPDMRGRVLIGSSYKKIGDSFGAETVALVGKNMPAHKHDATAASTSTVTGWLVETVKLNAYNGVATTETVEGNALSNNTGSLNTFVYSDQSPNEAMMAGSVSVDVSGLKVDTTTDVTLGDTGIGQEFSIMQPYTVLNCIIAVHGHRTSP